MTKLTHDQLERAKKGFETRDSDNNGTLTHEEFSSVMRTWFNEQQIEERIKLADPDGDGVISYQEFLNDYEREISQGD
ncbi:EF-hand domain-containing protein [Pseudomonas bohemica]|uniref:EF-hand domain-containing protein n=1 Tax=Pseudomonas bohemica TaxID=2044872 RepID=UPI000DA5F0CF|nr:EF-hand domain-containing protein [Pseudomonas bohemica]